MHIYTNIALPYSHTYIYTLFIHYTTYHTLYIHVHYTYLYISISIGILTIHMTYISYHIHYHIHTVFSIIYSLYVSIYLLAASMDMCMFPHRRTYSSSTPPPNQNTRIQTHLHIITYIYTHLCINIYHNT